MLGDKQAVAAAGNFLGANGKIDVDTIAARGFPGRPADDPLMTPPVPQSGPQMMSIIGRRAAILGLAVLKDPSASGALVTAWTKDRSLAPEAARAMGWCGVYEPATSFAELVKRGQKGSVEAAQSLGWMFDPGRPSKLSRLAIGNNYHEEQVDFTEANRKPGMVRNFFRLGDYYLFSTPLGGAPVGTVAPRPATQPAKAGG
jgi:hypothetical protein